MGRALWAALFMLFKLNLPLPHLSLALISFWNRTCQTGRDNVTLGLQSNSAEAERQKDGAVTSKPLTLHESPKRPVAITTLCFRCRKLAERDKLPGLPSPGSWLRGLGQDSELHLHPSATVPQSPDRGQGIRPLQTPVSLMCQAT